MARIARSRMAAACALAALVVASSGFAQDSTGESTGSDGSGEILLEISLWLAQPTGLDYVPGTEIDPDDLSQSLLRFQPGTDKRGRYRGSYEFPGRIGELAITYYSHEDLSALVASSPGEFVYGETLVNPLHAGVFDDGLADRVDANTVTRLRDFRIDYYRPAFSNDRASAKWFVGWRRVFHSREMTATYFALVPDLPPILPPVTQPTAPRLDLVPIPDVAFQKSQFEGRGPEAGMDFLVPLMENRIEFEAGFAVAVLRGNFETDYRSMTALYVIDDGVSTPTPIAPPYDEFNDPMLLPDIDQVLFPVNLSSGRLSGDAMAYDAYLGFRWRAWKQLEVFGGFRASRYDDVALDLRPKQVTYGTNGVLNVQDASRTVDSAGYEGFYGGIAYRF